MTLLLILTAGCFPLAQQLIMEPLTKHVRELAELDAKSAPKRRLAILQVRAGGAW